MGSVNFNKAHHYSIRLMGCHFVLTAVHKDPQLAWDAIRAGVDEIMRIESLISSWREDSETAEINRMSGISAVKVEPELFDLIARSYKVSELTCGAFDITGNLARYYWDFAGQEVGYLPSNKLSELRSLLGYRHIHLDHSQSTVFLNKTGMKIGFGGIGKGYAAQRASQVMRSMGINSGLINASGDLMCWGTPPGLNSWEVNIPDPKNRAHSAAVFNIPSGAIVTSGDYENYLLIDGVRYSHIVDPRTGHPVRLLKSVTVICPNPELGDALATAISVLGPIDGVALIDQLIGVECLVIDGEGNKFYSKGLEGFTKVALCA